MSRFVELRRAQPLLGTYVEIRGRAQDELCVRRGLQAGFAAIAYVHRLMSFHDASSDVSRLNRDGFHKAVSVDEWTWRVLSHAQKFAESSGGAFDVTIAPLLSKWGYLPRGQPADESASFRDVILESRCRVRFRKPLSLDLGGIAKGFAVDRAVESLRAGSRKQVELAQQDLVSAQAAIKKVQIEVERGRDLLEDDLRVPADPPANRKDETEDEVPIIAPADGYIIEKNVTPGKTVELSSVTFVIGDLSKVWMFASVRQEDLEKIRVGQSAFVTLPGLDGARFPGKITNLGQQFDPDTRDAGSDRAE